MFEKSGDDDDPQSRIGVQVGLIIERIQKGDVAANPIQLDDDDVDNQWADDEEAYEAEIQRIERSDPVISLEEEDKNKSSGGSGTVEIRCSHYKKNVRNPCLCGSHEEAIEYTVGDTRLDVGQVVGLTKEVRVGRYVVDFIEITCLLVHRITGLALVRGVPYTRTRNLDGRLPPYQNEICQVLEIDSDDPRPPTEQSSIEVNIEDIRPEPRIFHITNKSFPDCRFDPACYASKEEREERAPLTCRWAHRSYYPDKRFRRAQRPVDGEILVHYMEDDVIKNRHRTSDVERMKTWRRGEYIRGGSYMCEGKAEGTDISSQPDEDGFYLRRTGQKYTAADMFSGAGGYTCGSKMAGIHVVRAVDHWPRCNATYRANHPAVELHETDIMAHCNDLTVDHDYVDLVHLSPPCQTWSPAHTCAGRNDEANIAALYACQYIVEMLRPRFLTFEQTFGLVQARYLPFFNALVQSLARYGYSLKWKVFALRDFGLPQTRKRLIMIGAAPGQPLPAWPAPTHGAAGGDQAKRPFVSAIRACRGLVDGEGLHDASGARALDRPPWDGNHPMNRTITTSGGQAYHWDGCRELTLAEFARLQGFPHDYEFVAPCIKKQIGNAFPPVVVLQLMKHMRSWMEGLDRIKTEPVDYEVISISSDDDSDDHPDDDPGHGKGDEKPQLSEAEVSEQPRSLYRQSLNGFDYLNSGLTEGEALMAAQYESKQHAAGTGATVEAQAPYTSAPTARQGFLNPEEIDHMTFEEQMEWAIRQSQTAASQDDRRRRSSGGSSSVVITGSQPITTVIEDDEEEKATPDPVRGDTGSGSETLHNSPERPSTSTSGPAGARELAIIRLAESSRSGSRNPFPAAVAAGPSSWQPARGSETTVVGGSPGFFRADDWQTEMDEDEAMAAAVQLSLRSRADEVESAGEEDAGGFASGSVAEPVGAEEEYEEEYEGKGKGKAVMKRSYDGADGDGDEARSPKRNCGGE